MQSRGFTTYRVKARFQQEVTITMTEPYETPTSTTSSEETTDRDRLILEALKRRDETALRDVTRLYGRMLHSIALQ